MFGTARSRVLAAVDYSDDSGNQLGQTMWEGTKDNWQDTTTWGSIQLG